MNEPKKVVVYIVNVFVPGSLDGGSNPEDSTTRKQLQRLLKDVDYTVVDYFEGLRIPYRKEEDGEH